MLDSDCDSEWNESEEFYSDQELTTDESSDYETWTYAKTRRVCGIQWTRQLRQNCIKMNSAEQYEDKSSVCGETDGGNSDICNLADFSSEDEDIPVERNSGCQSVNTSGVDLIEGMTPMEYVPMPRESRRKWPKEDLIYRPKSGEPDIEDRASVFHTKFASPQLETAVPPPVSVDVEIPSNREIKSDFDPGKRAGKNMDITKIIMANLNDHNKLGYGDRPVTEAAPELMTKPAETLVTCTFPAVIDNPKPGKKVWCETERKDIPVGREEMTFVCLLPKTLLPGTHQLVEMEDDKRKDVDHQCGACWYPNSNNRPVTYTCWDCRCLMALCCGVSCLVSVVTSRFIGIDLFIDGRHTHTWESGLLGNPMTLYDVIRVYTKMNWNFKGGTNNVMIKYNDMVDSRRLQQWTVDNHSSLAHTSARDKPIREKGRFGYVDTPVPDADWFYRCTVRFVPVGYLRSEVDRDQSTDAAPVTESQVLYTLLRLYKYCAAGYTLSWIFLQYGVEKPA